MSRTRTWRAALVGAVGMLLVGTGLTTTPSQAGWTNPAVTLGTMADNPIVLVNEAGTSFAVWQDRPSEFVWRALIEHPPCRRLMGCTADRGDGGLVHPRGCGPAARGSGGHRLGDLGGEVGRRL
ncbi:MAG: hypothetical protein V9G04_00375 [Nocardioides sp.]